jgi:hypothetical protein
MNPAEHMTWNASETTLHGKVWPRSTAVAPDRRTAIEIVGPPDGIKQLSAVGQIADETSAQQLALYMAMAVQLILPQWQGANAWLTASLRLIQRKPNAITMSGWHLRMEWLKETATVTLKATR